jgi:hypothetical protein
LNVFETGVFFFIMQIVIQTIQGTYIVPTDKQAELILWLQNNAVKAGAHNVRENTDQQTYSGQQLITEEYNR